MGHIEKTVFISYRHTNFYTALAIYQDLTQHGFDVFFDYQSIDSGKFEKIIIENIKARAHFIVVLSPSALERCKEPNDWLRREIEFAIDINRNIVPLMMEGFDFGSPSVIQALSGKLGSLNSYNGVRLYADYFFEAMEKLRHRYLSVALEDIVLHMLNEDVKETTNTQKIAANESIPVQSSQLTAEEWFEKGYIFQKAKLLNEAIRCYVVAIRLKPDFADAYSNRGTVYRIIGNLGEAAKDYEEAIRLRSDDVIVRSSLMSILRKLDRDADAENHEKIARDLIQKEKEYNRACFEAVCGNTDRALELLKLGLEKEQTTKQWARQDPDFENIRNDPRFKELVRE